MSAVGAKGARHIGAVEARRRADPEDLGAFGEVHVQAGLGHHCGGAGLPQGVFAWKNVAVEEARVVVVEEPAFVILGDAKLAPKDRGPDLHRFVGQAYASVAFGIVEPSVQADEQSVFHMLGIAPGGRVGAQTNRRVASAIIVFVPA